ncbi:MAG TPA: GFA family protein [Candidatus Binataceae bacterium]|nr:GFA family protein [Candidatus Binataceae bacterium]
MALQGRCACGAARYQLTADPLIVHACHCRDCQRLTGSAFVINLWIEKRRLAADESALKSFRLEGGTGKPHDVFFCGECGTYLWSNYHGAPGDSRFVRAGTLDNPEAVKPDIHIFTRSKLPWIILPNDVPAFAAFYKLKDVWRPESQQRLNAMVSKTV